ncbi:MmcQ/YjbR family DNA-binding protein [Roseobacteraceae bacterium S113]
MSRDHVNTYCATLPGAELEDPWGGGHDAWKIGGKMFTCIGMDGVGVSVKTESIDQAQFLIDMGRAEKAPYFHRSWVRVRFDALADGDVSRDELEERIRTSFAIVRSGLTKKAQAALPPFET